MILNFTSEIVALDFHCLESGCVVRLHEPIAVDTHTLNALEPTQNSAKE
jgi:hypothetical protein